MLGARLRDWLGLGGFGLFDGSGSFFRERVGLLRSFFRIGGGGEWIFAGEMLNQIRGFFSGNLVVHSHAAALPVASRFGIVVLNVIARGGRRSGRLAPIGGDGICNIRIARSCAVS